MSSDETSFGVTYTSILSDYEESSDAEQAPVLSDYVSGPEYPEYLVLSDAEIPVEDQPHTADALPTALSSGYISDSDSKDDPEDGPTDYPVDGGDDDDDNLSGDDADDEDDEEASEEEEHLVLADSTDISPAVDLLLSAEKTEPFETDESAATPPLPYAYRTTARMSKRLCLTPGPRFKVEESSSAAARPIKRYRADYGFTGTLDAELRRDRVREIETITSMAMEGKVLEVVLRDLYALLVSALIVTSSNVNPLTSRVLKELLVQLNGLKEWILSSISGNCAVENQVKFATCTLHGIALTWWNTYVKTVGHDAAYGMSWKTLMKMMIAKYCPRNEIKKLEIKIWNLKVKGIDLTSYTQRFKELALMCGRMFLGKSDKVEKNVGGLPDMIQGSLMASKPKEMQDCN
nr:reverse transcriptase domain-containing protein [Tanacetum cinerariifolium]